MKKSIKKGSIVLLGALFSLSLNLLSAAAADMSYTSAAPSINFFWTTLNSNSSDTWIQREVVVEKSATNTYFAIIGNWTPPFYLGIQELAKDANGKPVKVALFSAWDVYSDNNCTKCSGTDTAGYGLIKVKALGEGVRGGRFGSEGTGAQAFIDNFNWNPGDTVQAVVHLVPKEDGSEISSAIRINNGEWKYFATYFYPKIFTHLEPGYSFIEDFGRTPTQERSATFRNSWLESEFGNEINFVSQVQVQPNSTNVNVGFHKVESRKFGAWAKSGGTADYSTKVSYEYSVQKSQSSTISAEARKEIFAGQSDAYAKYAAEQADFKASEEAKAMAQLKKKKLETRYSTCSKLNGVFVGGISKSSATVNRGAKTKFKPEVSKTGYALNSKLDVDRDGIACER